MSIEQTPSTSTGQDQEDLDELFELSEASSIKRERRVDPTYRTTERVFHLLHLLTLNERTREEIFEHLKDFYHAGGEPGASAMYASSKRLGRMLLRDIK